MTGPLEGGSLGDAYINVHAKTDDVEGDIRRGLDKAGPDAEKEADKLGTDVGDHIGKNVEKEVGKHGPGIGREIKDAVEKEVINVKPNLRYNVRGKDGRFIKRTAQGIADEVEGAFESAVAKGGIFDKISTAFRDALGAGFNVSGKSPLVGFLLPVYGALIGLVGAALQLVNAFAALATTAPAALAGIALQAGVLFLAFKGVGGAIQGAFAAKNAKELKEALVGITPAAQTFVKSLLPLRGLFQDLQYVVQQNFFKALGTSVTDVIKNIEPVLRRFIPDLGTALGGAVHDILQAFTGPEFKDFLTHVIPSTTAWVRDFGPAFGSFLLGFVKLGSAALPLLNSVGRLLNQGLGKLGENLGKLADDPKFTKWLADMLDTLLTLGPLLKSVFEFIVVFLKQLDAAGGKDLIVQLTKVLTLLTAFLSTEAGMRALNELIGLAILSFYALLGLAVTVLFLMASVQAFVQWLTDVAFPAIGKFFSDLASEIAKWFSSSKNSIGDFMSTFTMAFSTLSTTVSAKFNEIKDAVSGRISDVIATIRGLPGKVTDAIGNLGSLLFSAGRNLIQGLINGIENAIPGLRSALGFITNMLPSWKGPEDKDKKILKPAGEAVMAGFGAGIAAGAADIRAMLGDFTSDLGGIGVSNTSNQIMFGANALQINFRGAMPTQDEAMATGVAVGAGISSQLAARNTRLAVRTL